MRLLWVLFLAGGVAVLTAARPSNDEPRRIALLIGISDYQHFELDGPPGRSDLQGPKNDLLRMEASLRRFGFVRGADMQVLADAQASRKDFAEAFAWLARRARAGDAVVIYYAGHGTSVPDRDGDEIPTDGPDSPRDEALVPYDARNITDPAQVVLDDSLRVWLARIRTSNVTIVIDACYAGTSTRDVGPGRDRGPIMTEMGANSVASSSGLEELPYVVLTASHAQQQSKEDALLAGVDPFVGVFTYALSEVLDAAQPGTTYDALIAQVRSRLSRIGSRQIPQLEGKGAQALFGVSGAVARRPFTEIQQPALMKAFLPIGYASGVRTGALFDVYDSTEVAFTRFSPRQLRIDSVTSGRSFFTALSDAKVPPGSRAVLSALPTGAAHVETINVFVTAHAAHAGVRQLPFVQITRDSLSADAVVTQSGVIARGHSIAPLDAGWLASAGYVGEHGVVCNQLQRAYAIKALQLMQNPAPPAGLSVDVRYVPAGSGEPRAARNIDTLYAGEKYDVYFRVQRPSAQPVYLSAIYAGYLEQPVTVYPRESSLLPKPLQSMGGWQRLDLLYGQPYSHDGPYGTTQLVVYAGMTQFDFRSFEQKLPVCTAVRSRDLDPAMSSWMTVAHTLVHVPKR